MRYELPPSCLHDKAKHQRGENPPSCHEMSRAHPRLQRSSSPVEAQCPQGMMVMGRAEPVQSKTQKMAQICNKSPYSFGRQKSVLEELLEGGYN